MRDRDEQGSTLIIAMIVLTVLTTLSLGVLARSLSVMTTMRRGQDFDAALALADAGLADATAKLDQGVYASSFSSGGPVSYGNGRYQYKATQVDAKTFDVQTIGIIGRSRHAVRATVARGIAAPYTLFTEDDLNIPSATSAPLAGGLALQTSSWLTLGGANTHAVHIGSNNNISIGVGADGGDFQHAYGPGCSGCSHRVLDPYNTRYDPPAIVVPSTPSTYRGCPALGVFTGVVDGANGKPFVCNQDVTLAGVISVVNPPFVLYVADSAAHRDPGLDMRTAVVNAGQRADNVIINKTGSGPLQLQTTVTVPPATTTTTLLGGGLLGGSTTTSSTTSTTAAPSASITVPASITFSGVLNAPDTDVPLQSSLWWTGSIMVKSVKVTGTPLLVLGYDLHLQDYLDDRWNVQHYAEIPAAQAQVS